MKTTYFHRLDIVEAYLIFFMDYHDGQNGGKYRRACKILAHYKPLHSWSYAYDDLSRNGKAIYRKLELRYGAAQ